MLLQTHLVTSVATRSVFVGMKWTAFNRFQASEIVSTSVEYNGDFIARMIPKLEWPAVVSAATMVSGLLLQ